MPVGFQRCSQRRKSEDRDILAIRQYLGYPCEVPDLLEAPRPRKIKSSSKVTKSDFRGSPKVTLKVTRKVTFDPKSDSKVTFSGQKVTFRVALGETPESHFSATFELLLIFRGFGASRRSGTSQGYSNDDRKSITWHSDDDRQSILKRGSGFRSHGFNSESQGS